MIVTATEQLSDYVAKLRERGVELVVAKAHLPLRQTAYGRSVPKMNSSGIG
jgi:2',3'-cyclic-nucleotide 2'-phosphodiesterase (5'-nucleotidase family)